MKDIRITDGVLLFTEFKDPEHKVEFYSGKLIEKLFDEILCLLF